MQTGFTLTLEEIAAHVKKPLRGLRLAAYYGCVTVRPEGHDDPEYPVRMERLLETLGAEVVRMDPQLHDRALASLSHLPHLVAYALVLCQLKLHGPEEALRLSGGGLRDFTRIAASHPVMWRDICLNNREEILRSLALLQDDRQDVSAPSG